jgi:hypothetical protein
MQMKYSDPFGDFIRPRLNHFQFAALILGLNLLIDFSGAGLYDAFWSGDPFGLFQDTTAICVDFLLMPILGGYYLWSINGTNNIVEELRTSRVLVDKPGSEKAVEKPNAKPAKDPVFQLALAVSTVVTIWLFGSFTGWLFGEKSIGWLNNGPLLPWFRIPMWFLAMYTLFYAVINIVSTIFALRQLFREQSITISPWHPDRCGGIRGISRYSLALSYGLAIVGAVASVLIVQEIGTQSETTSGIYYIGWLGIGIYIILAPLVFFWPLGTAHQLMKEAKSKYLLSISQNFDNEYTLATTNINEDADQLERRIKKIQQLRELYKLTEAFPIWPFDVTNLGRFLTVLTAPLIPPLINFIFAQISIRLPQ